MAEILALICARSGSKGLPGKNLKILGDKPLIAHSIEVAQQTKQIADILVSTDCENIAEVAHKYGARVPFLRPAELAGDNANEWLVWQHMLRWLELNETLPKTFVVLPPTAPLRLVGDVEGAIDLYHQAGADGVLCATDAHRNPYFNMVMVKKDQRCELAFHHSQKFHRRQDADVFYDVTTVCYVMNSEYVMGSKHLFDGDIFMHYVPPERAVDIDVQFDFDVAEFLYRKQNQAEM